MLLAYDLCLYGCRLTTGLQHKNLERLISIQQLGRHLGRLMHANCQRRDVHVVDQLAAGGVVGVEYCDAGRFQLVDELLFRASIIE